jgi:mRNA interferase MazF
MATTRLKVARIGNSRGVRLPAAALRRYRIRESVLMEERSDGILLRPTGPAVEKLSWEETAREMAQSHEDWSLWQATVADGLDDLPWEPGRRSPAAPSAGQVSFVKRYEVRWTAFDPARRAETRKTRPAVIVSLDMLNQRLQTVVVCPLTTQVHPAWRSRVQVRCGGRVAEVAVDQIRSVSKTRLGDKVGALTTAEAAALRRVITEMYGE